MVFCSISKLCWEPILIQNGTCNTLVKWSEPEVIAPFPKQ